ncbi:hypothetical protein [Paracoccus sp. (in: a-proteobacteria)]|uniref:hypothetical protein n=1 Tax=Paracoccus sp. TaxID=267 RepID=UPI00289E0C45|nr:hypothetical protein [Paracoccus sp. (in: a-proteobacteria)]
MTAPAHYGNRRVPKMLAQVNALRRVIAAEGTPGIQDACAKVEEHIDFAYGRAAPGTTSGSSPDSDG